MNKHALSIFGAALLANVAGCVSPTPNLDRDFGNAVRTARAQMTINPEASRNADAVNGMDGEASKETIDRYEQSFKAPPPVVNVINIGGGIAGGGGGK